MKFGPKSAKELEKILDHYTTAWLDDKTFDLNSEDISLIRLTQKRLNKLSMKHWVSYRNCNPFKRGRLILVNRRFNQNL